jgi:hypothetical protein
MFVYSFFIQTASPSSGKKIFGGFFHSDDEDDITFSLNKEAVSFKRDKELDAEIIYFSNLLKDSNALENIKTSLSFWKEQRKNMPKLFDLQIILLNISSTSSFIERFYCIAGIVCEIRRSNMNEDLVTMRSMMKANMKLLTDLNKSFG